MSNRSIGVRDVPIQDRDEDALGLARYAHALGRFILACDTPITVGIQGDWGSGKTSMMNLIQRYVEAEGEVLTITLNTWQYAQVGGDDALPLLLLEGLQRKVIQEPGRAEQFLGWARRTFRVRSVQAGILSAEFGSDEPEEDRKDLDDLKGEFAKEVARRLQASGKDRLVVFIDDLDRVLPERAVAILEVLKNFVDVEGCVYVIACDYEVVVKGLKAKFDVGEDDLGGRSFFDKIIQVPFRMPVHSYDVQSYVRRLLEGIGWTFGEQDLPEYQALLEHSVGFNPRSVKRLFNTLLLLRNVVEGGADARTLSDPRRLKMLFGLVCLEAQYNQVYAALASADEDDLTSRLLLEPRSVLDQSDDLAFIRDAPGFEDSRHRLEAFLMELGKVVDANGDRTLDDAERAALTQMLQLSSITTVSAGGATRKARLSEGELHAIARKQGLGELAALVEGILTACTRYNSDLRLRRTKSTFSYDARMRRADSRRTSWNSVLSVMVYPRDGALRVGVSKDRLLALNPEGIGALLEFLDGRTHWEETWSEHYVELLLRSESDAQTFGDLVRPLAPFNGGR